MARSKTKKRSGKSKRFHIKMAASENYWQPVARAILAQTGLPAVAAVSPAEIGDGVYTALTAPLQEALRRMLDGTAQFQDFWCLLQGAYFMLYAYEYVLTEENYRFASDGAVSEQAAQTYWKEKHTGLLDRTAHDYTAVFKSVGERQKRTNRYGLTGEEQKLLHEMLENLGELLDWGSIRMVYHAASCVNTELRNCEHRILQSRLKG